MLTSVFNWKTTLTTKIIAILQIFFYVDNIDKL